MNFFTYVIHSRDQIILVNVNKIYIKMNVVIVERKKSPKEEFKSHSPIKLQGIIY